MLKIYQSNAQGSLIETSEIEHNSLIYLVNPSKDEILQVAMQLNIPKAFFRDSLDKNERPRIEKDKDALLIVLNTPFMAKEDANQNVVPYQTSPIGIIHTENNLIIVSRQQLPILNDLIAGQYGMFQSYMKTRISLLLFKAVAESYNQYLTQINKKISELQQKLKSAYRNHELFGLINLNKSLVFFSTSLSAMTILYKRMMDGHDIKIHAEEKNRLEDILIDIRQAAEITEMRRESLSNLMDAYAAIIHNNLNSVLKMLTTVAIVMIIPTMLGSVFSMNVALPHEEEWITTVVVAGLMLVTVSVLLMLFYKKKYLRVR
ncbi:magnesium transporter CorA family protein [Acinetobacter pullicarnis]|uniref:magnesium transporter CorA family protein n=1 Tax=Acinetobacter pullicarnis TaxID=2576829 RepID=UPI00111CAD13|nr:magnesium transporter CorA family protein [Acinetobacter pullicarnis]